MEPIPNRQCIITSSAFHHQNPQAKKATPARRASCSAIRQYPYDETTGLPLFSNCQSIPTTHGTNQAARLDISPKHLLWIVKFRLLPPLTWHLLRRRATFMHSWQSKSRICLSLHQSHPKSAATYTSALPMPPTGPRISRIGAESYSPDRWKRALEIARPSMGASRCLCLR